MKKIFKILMFLAVLFCISVFVIPMSENAYASDTLYFDNNGNLIFVMYNKAATGSVRYKTIGWIIKKYDEPRGAAGQISAVLATPQYSYDIVDKNNPGYKYSYFIIERAVVMKAVNASSEGWKKYLEKYGGNVYFDSVMTVTEGGVAKGGLKASGAAWGEVYYDFKGISGARGWAKPQDLLAYFDIPVGFPAAVKPPAMTYGEESVQYISISDSTSAGAILGSNTLSRHEYDIAEGIPAGEDLYLYGTAGKYFREGKLCRHTGTIQVPSKVVTDYELKWTDSDGTARSEINRVERWYRVPVIYEYYTVKSFDIYRLSAVQLRGGAAEMETAVQKAAEENIERTGYGDRRNHVSAVYGSYYAGKKTVISGKHRRPDVPEENQNALAQKGNAKIKVRSDRLVVGDSRLLSGEWTDKAKVGRLNAAAAATVYYTDIIIDEKVKNGMYADEKAVFIYKCGGAEKRLEVRTGNLTVHTPVVCRAGVSSPKMYNMSVSPVGNQLVLGTEFSIKLSASGQHRDITGYGSRDYESCVGKRFVRFPFRVRIGGEEYSADTWIESRGESIRCSLPADVDTGLYTVDVMCLAKNASTDSAETATADGKLGDTANIDISQYGARQSVGVEVIGTLYGVHICGGAEEKGTAESGTAENGESMSAGDCYVGSRIGFGGVLPDGAGAMPYCVMQGDGFGFELSIFSNGFGRESDEYIRADITYYSICDGRRREADVYCVSKHDIIGGGELTPAVTVAEWRSDRKSERSDNVYEWRTELKLGQSIVVMPKGIEPLNEEIIDKYAIKNGNILINMEIYGNCGEKEEYSYINVENSDRGYCNMWKTEGYTYEFVDKSGVRQELKDGDSVILTVPGVRYGDYEIVGTH